MNAFMACTFYLGYTDKPVGGRNTAQCVLLTSSLSCNSYSVSKCSLVKGGRSCIVKLTLVPCRHQYWVYPTVRYISKL